MSAANRRATLGFACAVVACSWACSSARHDDAPTPAAPAALAAPSSGPAAPGPKVYLAGGSGEIAVEVEVVSTPAAVERGLMYREYLPANAGMLFLLDRTMDWKFWMRNTLIPLDMIFIRPDLTVAGVVQNAPPLTDDTRSVGELSRYVLEVNGGWTAAHGVTKNAKVRFERVQ